MGNVKLTQNRLDENGLRLSGVPLEYAPVKRVCSRCSIPTIERVLVRFLVQELRNGGSQSFLASTGRAEKRFAAVEAQCERNRPDTN